MNKKMILSGFMISVVMVPTISCCSEEQPATANNDEQLTLSQVLTEDSNVTTEHDLSATKGKIGDKLSKIVHHHSKHSSETGESAQITDSSAKPEQPTEKEEVTKPVDTTPVDTEVPSSKLTLRTFELQDNSPQTEKTVKGRLVSWWHKIWPTTNALYVLGDETFDETDLAEQVKLRVVSLHNVFTPHNKIYKSVVNNNNIRGRTLTACIALLGFHHVYKTMDKELPFLIGFVQSVSNTSLRKLGIVAALGLATKYVMPRVMTYWQTKGIKQQIGTYKSDLKTQLEPHKDKEGLREHVLKHNTTRRSAYEALVHYLLPEPTPLA